MQVLLGELVLLEEAAVLLRYNFEQNLLGPELGSIALTQGVQTILVEELLRQQVLQVILVPFLVDCKRRLTLHFFLVLTQVQETSDPFYSNRCSL